MLLLFSRSECVDRPSAHTEKWDEIDESIKKQTGILFSLVNADVSSRTDAALRQSFKND